MTNPTAGGLVASSAQQIIASLVRTFTPILVGVLVTGFAHLKVDLDTGTAEMLVNGVISAAVSLLYYLIARLLEVWKSSKFGWLLLYAKAAPLYVQPAKVASAAASDGETTT